MLLFSGLSYGIQSTKSIGNGTYLENLGGVVDRNGRAYIGDIFIDSGASLPGLGAGSQGSQGLIVSLLISHDGMVDMLSKSGVLPEDVDVGSFTNLLPPTFAVMVYAGVPKPDAESRASTFSSAFSSAYGVSLQKIAAFGMTQSFNDLSQVPFTIILYQSPSTFSDVAGIYMDQYVGHGGFAELVDEASRNGRLIPHANSNSADGSLIFTGMVDLAPLSEFLPFGEIPENFTDIVTPLLEGPVGVSGGFSYFNHGYTKVGGKNMLDLLSLLGAEKTPLFSPDATSSLMILMAPNSTDTGGPDEGANVKITTTLPLGQVEYDLIYHPPPEFIGQVHLGKPGEQLGGQSFQVEIEGVALPLNARITKNVSPETTSPNGVVQVTVTVKNDDSKAMTDVLVDDGMTISGYPTSASVVSGSTSMTVGSVTPGESKSLTYGIRLGEAGAYTLKPASLTYSYAGKVFEDNSNQPEARVERPNALFLAFGIAVNTWSLAADGLTALMGGGGMIVIIGLTLLILGYVAFNWFKSFRKWLSGPSPPPASPS
jgi:hypothetical protein